MATVASPVINEYGTYAPVGHVCPACRQVIDPDEPARRGYRRPEDAVNLTPAYWHANRCPQQVPFTHTEERTHS